MRWAAAALLLCFACGPNRRSVRPWIERDMECRDVDITHIEFYYFEAEGCEQRRVFHCPNRSVCEGSRTDESSGEESAENLDPPS